MIKSQAVFQRFLILNASGVMCTEKCELQQVLQSEADAAITKTMTLSPREGNPEPRLFFNRGLSVNSMGLPNKGVDYYCGILPELRSFAKPVFASVAAFCADDYLKLVKRVEEAGFDALEVNLSCPNLEKSGIFAYDLELTLTLAERIRKKFKKTLGLKLPPYPERWQIKKLSETLQRIGVDFVTLSNSWPLGCVVDAEKERTVIKPNFGIGGLGGGFFKYIVLGQVRLFYSVFKGRVKIIATGGVSSGADVYEYALAGANGVGIGTALLAEGEAIFARVKAELSQILQKRKTTLEQKIGALKEV